MWALAQLKHRPDSMWMNRFEAHSQELLTSYQPQNLSNTLHAFAMFRWVQVWVRVVVSDSMTLVLGGLFVVFGWMSAWGVQGYKRDVVWDEMPVACRTPLFFMCNIYAGMCSPWVQRTSHASPMIAIEY